MPTTTGPTAAIAGIAPGIQSSGVWTGRRQLFVRFAAEAETAVLYTPPMLARHLERAVAQSALHSIALCGGDPLASADLIEETLAVWRPELPVMLDCNGQRPDVVSRVARSVHLIQITPELGDRSATDNALRSLAAAAAAGKEHGVVLAPRDGISDAQVLRFVEQAHATAPGMKLVIHPTMGPENRTLDARFATLLERAMSLHHDTVLLVRIPGGSGAR